MQTIVPAEPGNWLLPLAVSPDGQTLVYLAVAEDPFGEPVRSVWRVGADGGKARQLATPGHHLESVQFTWTGDGSLLLAEELSLFIQGERAGGEDTLPWVALMVTRPDGSRAPVMVMPGSFTGFVEVLSWLPPGAFQDPATVAVLQGAVSVPSPVTGLPSGLRLSAGSSASADGERVLLVDDRMGQGVVVWHRTAEVGRALGQRIGDPSWVPRQPVLAGVLRNAPGQRVGSSAGIVFGVESIRSWTSYDLRVFDPIEIDGQPHRRYARPLVAPGGLAVAFFTVDDQAGTVELWIATADGRTRRVPIESDWPAGSPLGEARPVALWLDRGTLLYAAPEDWEAGLPRRVTLWCVAVTADGQLAAEPAMTIDARGREAGIHLRELALSPDGTRLAYRLRHYTRSDPASGAFDTLVVVPVADASRQLEIARGKPGDGLDWSPDSRWLVAGLRGRVELLSADGRRRVPLSPEGVTASYPVWVDPHTVWYQQVDGDEEVVMAVEVW
ncbi:hypothetical protein NET02_15680 [Thermomicrobiaceae bacterium CFH 74404]|uniref:Uncharacterized protein n=1 Tax=Thermalbibacter longus TaxID=2951981 RepID=A0AA42BB50_9BACT|nr:hypothetical protein [Thermalbibacter longus]MCM8750586.1 hypothetical protein [Thermalbibacter longus]